MLFRAVAHIALEAVAAIKLAVTLHKPVAVDFRNYRRRADRITFRVAFNNGHAFYADVELNRVY